MTMKKTLAGHMVGAAVALGLVHSAIASTSQGVPVLMYHELVTDPSRPLGETVVPLDKFKAQMAFLAAEGYHTISMDELVAHMKWGAPLPNRPVVLTFDDGWRNALQAVPVLREHGFKASFWIIAGPKGIGGDYMDWQDIRALAGTPGIEVQSHSMSHPWDPKSNLVTWMSGQPKGHDQREVEAELRESRLILQQQLGRSVRYFAWPCGWFTDPMVDMAKGLGYTALLTAMEGLNRQGGDVMRIRRTFIDGNCGMQEFKQSVQDGRYRVCTQGGRVTLGQMPDTGR